MSETYTNNVGRSDYRLPTVNTSDNGKVLKVVEGEWKKAEGGGSSDIPEYAEADAGKVLKVAEGGESLEWGAAGGGGGGITLIPMLLDDQTGVPYLDKTWSEIYIAMSTTGCIIKDPSDALTSIDQVYHDLDSGTYYVNGAGGLQFSATQQSDKPVIAGN